MSDYGVSVCVRQCVQVYMQTHTHTYMHGKWITSHTMTPTTSLGFQNNCIVIYLCITQMPM